MGTSSDRRRFLKSVAGVGVAVPVAALGADSRSHRDHAEHVAQTESVKGQSQAQAYGWLTLPEQAFIEAAVARLIPADELGPGAKEAGVSYFIDRQLAGAYGTMARNYRQGPLAGGHAAARLSVAPDAEGGVSRGDCGNRCILQRAPRQSFRGAARRAAG